MSKKLSEPRCFAQHDATSALFGGYSNTISALFQVAENLQQKIETRATAKGLLNKINNLGLTIIVKSIHSWRNILCQKEADLKCSKKTSLHY